MRAYLIMDNGKLAQTKPFVERYQVVIDPVKAINLVKDILGGTGYLMKNEQHLINENIGMLTMVSSGDIEVSIMPIEVN